MVSVLLAADYVRCEQKTLTRVFEPFFATKPEGEGTWLDLAMVYGIIKQNKGFIYGDGNRKVNYLNYLPPVQV